jgi:hypothetical protein
VMNIRAWLALVALLAIPSLVTADEGSEGAAKQAALEWLALVDRGEYEASWKAAASFFRLQIDSAKWESAVASVRRPLGAVEERHFQSARYTRELPGAPDGEYVVLQFQTKFANKAEAIETVTPAMDGSTWKVTGYFIR